MHPPFHDSPEFRRLLSGDPAADLTRIALEIARDAYPDLDTARYLRLLDGLAERVCDRCPEGAEARQILGQINWVLFIEEAFRGNAEDYYDPRNSYLNEVLDRKLGIPITLSVLYLAVAERIGLEMAGVNLPAHFLIRTGRGGRAIFVDPFHGGTLLDRRGCERRIEEVTGQAIALSDEQLAPCPMTAIVARMLRNLKAIYLREGDFAAALPVQRRLVALEGNDPRERRDLGVSCLQADRPGEAVSHLQTYLQARPQAEDAEAIAVLLSRAWREWAQRN
ncbi:MAG: transglutaminase family protein [Isosphaeraceae bacterium]|nr:transglutaminase family protein [Isosphaeraceae bacterium]